MTTTLAILAAVGALVASSALSYSIGAASARLKSPEPSPERTADNG